MLTLLALAAATTTAGPATVQTGVERWRAGDDAGAVAAWLPYAAQGVPDALFNMGQAYKLGRGVTRDQAIARDYYRKAAAKGHLPAQANLGITLFQAGEKAESLRWLKTAADRGEARAQYVYGIALYNGDGAPRNQGVAYGYLLRAREAKLPQAATALVTIEPALTPEAVTAGQAVAASLASGAGVPTALAAAGNAKPAAPRRADVLKTPTPPVQTATVPPPATPRVTPPVQTAAVPSAATVRATPPVVTTRPPVVVGPPRPADIPAQTAAATPATTPARPPVVAATTTPPRPTPLPASTTPPRPAAIAAAPSPMPTTTAQADPSPRPPATVTARAEPTPKPPATVTARAEPSPKPPASVAKPDVPRARDWRVQLGAFSSQKQADAAWTSVKTAQGSAIGKAKPIFEPSGPVVKVQLGPFASKAAASDVCAKLAFAGRACFVTQG
ncbi:SPOR domain-containing protein [Glacieibacterium frigidum]|uniref:SPOR domain-containing protein n=1 Tax=Glacieibacterium frigidum TaxID=2593303 RepID=A0A552U8W7_9SPHN|nr:SPOR domain-containing protein [Glacieibacterium frigidum]TRW14655.1 hypothetical protein FMM06_13275 [Glacieibacterium frigidum]